MHERRQARATDAIGRSAERRALRRLQSRERRRRMGVRADIVAGVAIALLLILIAPGLAVVAAIALLGLLACGVSLLVERRRRRTRERRQ